MSCLMSAHEMDGQSMWYDGRRKYLDDIVLECALTSPTNTAGEKHEEQQPKTFLAIDANVVAAMPPATQAWMRHGMGSHSATFTNMMVASCSA